MSRPLIGQWILTKVFQLDYIVVIKKLHPFPLLIDLHFFLTSGQQGTLVTLLWATSLHFIILDLLNNFAPPIPPPRPAWTLTRLQLTRLMGP